MKARRNKPIANFEQKIDGGVNNLFARIFHSPLQPTEVDRRLINAMEDNILLQGEGKRLVPNSYDIFISMADHQHLSPGEETLKKDWRAHMIEVARERNYTLHYDPILRLHGDPKLRIGTVRVEAELLDPQKSGGGSGAGGIMSTQTFTPEQAAQMRAQLPIQPAQPTPGMPFPSASSPNQPARGPNYPPASSIPPAAPAQGAGTLAIPAAKLVIRMSNGGQQVYRIEKSAINIGRQVTNDIIVEDKKVSRYHAKIQYQNGDFTIYDLGSTNGITVNGVPNLRQYTFRDSDRFTIGSYDFYFERK